ncbi:MAG TPA: substrate-binding domain-containing protein [Pyrinomonadaceae bacterium]|jgi:D-xylose transport system substrate-binding protein|nr:substrate-binding domain-containing protein [Pyrinomonadaceae bacterium]
MRRLKRCLAALVLPVLLGACVSPQQGQGGGGGNANGGGAASGGYQRKTKKPGETVRIGFSMDTLKEERWQRDKQLVEARAREVGAELDVQVANSDDAVQTKQCDNLLTKGVDVLIVAPHNGEIAASIVEAAHRQGVPVISYDRLIRNSDVDLYVSHQVEKMGEMQGRYALEHAPKGNYVLVGGAPTDNNAMLMRKGQMNVLGPAKERGDIQIVSDQFAKDWRADEALRITEDAITKTNGNIAAVVASNDGTAGGAISALDAAKLTGKVIVTGQDAQLDAVQSIAAGKQSMTIYKPIKPLADSAVDNALKLARGETLTAPDRINNGKIDVPAILHEPTAVDKNNLMDTVIKDGYHKLEDVYKDVPRDQWPKTTAGVDGRSDGGPFVAALALMLGGLGLALRLR